MPGFLRGDQTDIFELRAPPEPALQALHVHRHDHVGTLSCHLRPVGAIEEGSTELHQGISTALRGRPGVLCPVPGPGVLDGTERRDEALSGLRVQGPVDADPALDGGGDLEVAALPQPPGTLLGPTGICSLAPVGDRHPELTGRRAIAASTSIGSASPKASGAACWAPTSNRAASEDT